jgi:transposase
MLRPENTVQVYLYAEPTDMRKSIDGLAILVEQEMALPLNTDALFVFCNRGRDKIKLLCWERNGFIVWYKRLEKQRFKWPKLDDTLTLTGEELNWLLDGFDLFNNKPHCAVFFSSVT